MNSQDTTQPPFNLVENYDLQVKIDFIPEEQLAIADYIINQRRKMNDIIDGVRDGNRQNE